MKINVRSVALFVVFTVIALAHRAFAQGGPVKINLEHWKNGGTVQTGQAWVNGNLHKTNSHYGESNVVPTRFVIQNLPAGQYSLTFEWLAAKQQGSPATQTKHAHDFLTTYNEATHFPANSGDAHPCRPLAVGSGTTNICTGGNTFVNAPNDTTPVPWDGVLTDPPFSGTQTTGDFSLWNALFTGVEVSGYTYDPNDPFDSSKSYTNKLTVFFDTTGFGGKPVVLALGAHLAEDDKWDGDNNGACDINGAPYHWEYNLVNTATGQTLQSGNRDRSIMCTGQNPTLTVVKQCFVGEEDPANEVTEDPFGNPIPFDFEGTGDHGLDSEFVVNCGDSQGFTINLPSGNTREFSVEELIGETIFDNGFGWDLRSVVCEDAKGNPPSGDYNEDDNPVTFNLSEGEDITCTFKNFQAHMPLNKLINGESANCTDPDTGDPTGDSTGVRPCTYENAGLTLNDGDPPFTVKLFLDSDENDPTNAPADLETPLVAVVIPPQFDASGFINVRLTICEVNASGYLLTSVDITITDVDGNVTNVSPTIFSANGHRCFDIFIPEDTVEFAIDLDNSNLSRTVTLGGWGAPPKGNNPGTILDSQACDLLPFSIGHTPHTNFFLTFSSTTSCSTTKGQSIRNYLKYATGTPHELTYSFTYVGTTPCTNSGDCSNGPTGGKGAGGAGIFGAQVLALYLNDWMGDHGVFAPFGSIGGFTVHCDGACDAADAADAVLPSVNGLTVQQILDIANDVLGGNLGALPAGYTSVPMLNDLINFINKSFENGSPSAWALAHLL